MRAVNRDGQRLGRLLFWQEQTWSEFAAGNAGLALSADAILAVFFCCEIHRGELRRADGAVNPEVRNTPEYDAAQAADFPCCAVYREWGAARTPESGAWVCDTCAEARDRWIATHPDLARVWRGPTTFAEFAERHFGGLPPELQVRARQQAEHIAAQMQPGDELWEWDNGGSHNLAGASGMAIMRNGEVVKKWSMMRS